MTNHMRAELMNQALSMALAQRQPCAGLIVHTDRGSQHGADSYRQLLRQPGSDPSMSRKGNCWAKETAKSVIHTQKTEYIYLEKNDTHEQAQTAVFEYIKRVDTSSPSKHRWKASMKGRTTRRRTMPAPWMSRWKIWTRTMRTISWM